MTYYYEKVPIKTFVGVPLLEGEQGHLRGVLLADRRVDVPFGEEDEHLMQVAAGEIKNDLGVEVSCYVHHGKIFKEIAEYASEEENTVDFVVMGTHGIKGGQKLFGSWALKVIAGSTVPFIVVQDDPPAKDRYTDIVFPIDFKSENKEKLQWAIFLGKYLNSKIHLYKTPLADKDLQKKVNINLNFAIRFLIHNNIEYEIHESKKSGN